MSAPLKHRAEYSAPCVVAISAFLLYLFCLAPSVATGGDCGELIAASYNLAIAHPSGYALYCLAGKIFATLLPFGEIAWRYNLFSAVCGAATCGVVALLVSRFTSPNSDSRNFWPALGAGLLLAGLTFFGAQSVIAEVYAPTGLIVALAFLCAANWNREPKWNHLAALGGVLGLSLNLHLSVLFLWPGLLVFFFLKHRENHQARRSTPLQNAAIFGFCFLTGLSITLYLPLRAATFPEPLKTQIGGQEYSWGQTLDWGHPVDFPRWKAHVLVQQYKSLLMKPAEISVLGRAIEVRTFAQTPSAALQQLLQLISYLALQFLWSTPLVLVGAIQSLRRQSTPGRALAAFFALTLLGNVFIAIHYRVDNIFDIANFLFPAYVVLAIWLGLGIHWLLEFAARTGEILDRRQTQRTQKASHLWRWRFLTTAKLFLLGAIITQWIFFIQTSSWRGNTRVKDATLLRAEAVEKLQQETGRAPSLLLFSDDALFPFWYAQKVLGKAKNVRTPWGAAMHAYQDQNKLPELAQELLKTGPVATTQWREDLDAKFPFAPITKTGNLWQLTTGVLPPPAQPINERDAVESGESKLNVVRAKFLQTEIRRAELVGFQIDFRLPNFPNQGLPVDQANQSTQWGMAEVLVAPRDLSLRPTPAQTPVFSGKKPLVWMQSRRLIVPSKTQSGAVLRATLPFEFPIELAPGDYEVWARIVESEKKTTGENKIEWKKVDSLRLIVR